MTEAIQQAYYLRAMNPSDYDTHATLADELGLDVVQFMEDLTSEDVELLLQENLNKAAALGVSGFPSLVLEVDGQHWPIAVAYQNELTTLNDIKDKIKWANAKSVMKGWFVKKS